MDKLIGELNVGEHLYCFGTDGTIIDMLIFDKRKHVGGITCFEGDSQLIQGNNPCYRNSSKMTWYVTPQTLNKAVSYDVATNIIEAKKIVSNYVFHRNIIKRR